MITAFNLHKTIAILINAAIIILIINVVITSKSDKEPIIFMVFYPALIIVNSIIAIILGRLKVNAWRIYRLIAIGQAVLFIPLTICITEIQ